jgi:hypothetical protein
LTLFFAAIDSHGTAQNVVFRLQSDQQIHLRLIIITNQNVITQHAFAQKYIFPISTPTKRKFSAIPFNVQRHNERRSVFLPG